MSHRGSGKQVLFFRGRVLVAAKLNTRFTTYSTKEQKQGGFLPYNVGLK
jgi:hypothetical protein